jgi:hypothetical protein
MPKSNSYYASTSPTTGVHYYYKRDRGGHVHRISKDSYVDETKTHAALYAVSTKRDGHTSTSFFRRHKDAEQSMHPGAFHEEVGDIQNTIHSIFRVIHHYAPGAGETHSFPMSELSVLNERAINYGLSAYIVPKQPTPAATVVIATAPPPTPLVTTPKTYILSKLNQVIVPVETASREECFDVNTALQNREKFTSFKEQYNGSSNTFQACLGTGEEKCKYALTILTTKTAEQKKVAKNRELLQHTAPKLFAELVNHWSCDKYETHMYLTHAKAWEALDTSQPSLSAADKVDVTTLLNNLFAMAAEKRVFLSGSGISLDLSDFIVMRDVKDPKKIIDLRLWNLSKSAVYLANSKTPLHSGVTLVSNVPVITFDQAIVQDSTVRENLITLLMA